MRTFLPLLGFLPILAVAAGCGCGEGGCPLELRATAKAESEEAPKADQHVAFLTDFAHALEEARRSGKPLLVFFETEECLYCHQMFEETFHDEQVIRLAENFVCLRIEAGDAPEICKDFHIEAFPTVQFITPEGAHLHRVLGKKEPATLAVQMQAALQDPHSRTAYRSAVIAK